jgi:hypothetical protein
MAPTNLPSVDFWAFRPWYLALCLVAQRRCRTPSSTGISNKNPIRFRHLLRIASRRCEALGIAFVQSLDHSGMENSCRYFFTSDSNESSSEMPESTQNRTGTPCGDELRDQDSKHCQNTVSLAKCKTRVDRYRSWATPANKLVTICILLFQCLSRHKHVPCWETEIVTYGKMLAWGQNKNLGYVRCMTAIRL